MRRRSSEVNALLVARVSPVGECNRRRGRGWTVEHELDFGRPAFSLAPGRELSLWILG
jgi:hypothetical protein